MDQLLNVQSAKFFFNLRIGGGNMSVTAMTLVMCHLKIIVCYICAL